MQLRAFRFLSILAVLQLCGASSFLYAQNFQAINGSAYAGSLAPSFNPAAIVHVPGAWDITPLALQFKYTTNAITIKGVGLLGTAAQTETEVAPGTYKRYAYLAQDLRLLNARVRLNKESAIAFGLNLRSHLSLGTSRNTWLKGEETTPDFMRANVGNRPLTGIGGGTSWVEGYLSYGRTVYDNFYRRVNAGITLKINRGIAGGYARTEGLDYGETTTGPGYTLTNGQLVYGYSANFDIVGNGKPASRQMREFLQTGRFNAGVDLGLEYIFLAPDADNAGAYAYNTKVGVSLLDVGWNRFAYGKESRAGNGVRGGITDTILQARFVGIQSFSGFNDSLASIAARLVQPGGDFTVYQPTRLYVNVDHHLTQEFYLNAALTIPVIQLAGAETAHVRDLNLLSLTPRWETHLFGLYLPMQMTIRKKVWIGAAAKLGPLLLGVHNLGNVFGKNSINNGGFYLALSFRPGKWLKGGDDTPEIREGKKGKAVDCPSF